jgi:RecA/RadA recombinase
MAKKKVNDDDFYDDLAEATGGEVLDEIETIAYYVDTGSLALNYICCGKFIGGGIPGGRITEIYGPSASSKSLIGTNILFGAQRINGVPLVIDSENAINKEFVKKASHCDLAKIIRYCPPTLEQCFKKMFLAIEKIRQLKGPEVPIVIVWDSITTPPIEREFKELKLPEKYTQAQFKALVGAKEQPGESARVISGYMRKLNAVMEQYNATVVIMNQTRNKIGVMFGNPETTGRGGKSIEFYASLRLRPQTQKKILKKLYADQAASNKKSKCMGINIKFKNVKNRTYRPYVESEGIKLYFDKGINPISGLLTCLLDADRVESAGKGIWAVRPEYTNGEEVKFKSGLEGNEVPMDVLLKCPALIDATDKDQVEEYLRPFMDAINYEFNEDVEEKTVSESDEEEADEEIDREQDGEE